MPAGAINHRRSLKYSPPPTYDQTILATPGIIHYYPLNNLAGSTSVNDLVGTMNSDLVSGVTFGTAGGCGDGSTCASGFNLGAQQIRIGATNPGPWPASGPFSIELGFYITSGSSSYQRIIGTTADNAQMYLQFSGGTLGVYPTTSTVRPDDNAWHFWVFTWSGTTWSHYNNGVAVGGPASSPAPDYPSSTDKTSIGDNSQAINGGKMQKVAFYNVALSASTVTAHYNKWVSG